MLRVASSDQLCLDAICIPRDSESISRESFNLILEVKACATTLVSSKVDIFSLPQSRTSNKKSFIEILNVGHCQPNRAYYSHFWKVQEQWVMRRLGTCKKLDMAVTMTCRY